jgi:putative ATP-dependent endonuclease of the OLD family
MYVVRLSVRNFRGIQSLDWLPSRGVNCLIGPGNSCKSTIVEALALLFTSRRAVTLSDADFFNCDISAELLIEAVVVDLPAAVGGFDAYGDLTAGWNVEAAELHEDPLDDDESALVLRFRADAALEPIWEVAKPASGGATKPLRASDRERLGVYRVEERPDFHLRWSRGSALAALSASNDEAGKALIEAHRGAREAVFDASLGGLKTTADSIAAEAAALGAAHFTKIRPGLDPAAVSGQGALVLHDDNVPLTSEGLGVRRLTSLAIQRLRAGERSVFLIDEIEHGLEPHRLLRLLRSVTERAHPDGGDQVFLTTHAPLVVTALRAEQLVVVRSADTHVTASAVPASLGELKWTEPQGTVRTAPEAMLAASVLVVEGPTEMGFIRGCTRRWDTDVDNLALRGAAVCAGGSDKQAVERSECFAELGYRTAALVDNDKTGKERSDLDVYVEKAKAAGVTVFQGPEGCALESHIVRDLPKEALQRLVELAISVRAEELGEDAARQSVLAQVSTRLPDEPQLDDSDPLGWVTDAFSLDNVRTAIADAATKSTKSSKPWFKTQRAGEQLADLVLDVNEEMRAQGGEKNFADHLDEVRSFLYPAEEGDGDGAPPAAD